VTAALSRRRGVVGPALFALAVLAILIGLGTWQIERKAWKEGLIATLVERIAAEPQPLPPPQRWPSLDRERDEFRHVVFAGEFTGEEALVYATASTLRRDVSGPGYWVFAPVKLDNGATVAVNRGFVPEGQQRAATQAARAGTVSMIGNMRWPEPRGWFSAADNPAKNLWFVRDQRAMAAAKKWGDVAPFYVELETATSDGDLPKPGRIQPDLPNNHLQYALTWFTLAFALAMLFARWLRSRWRTVSA
jgi:surfeit locus 1 family protein